MATPDTQENHSGLTLKDLQKALSNEVVYKGAILLFILGTIAGLKWATDQQLAGATPPAATTPEIKGPIYGPSLADIQPDPYPFGVYGAGGVRRPEFSLDYRFPQGWELSTDDPEVGYLISLRKGDAQFSLIRNFLDNPYIKTFSQYEDVVAKYFGFKGNPTGAVMFGRPGYTLKFISDGAYVMIKMVEVEHNGQAEVWQAQFIRKPNTLSVYDPSFYDPNQLLREAETIIDSFKLDLK
ncbi:MAG: hypothetical protein Q7R49_03035 [Candidatus Daviesbacteria bacterium]|nr:hypothetical protein [Candidatus Daviesbacteria bacterium]